MKLFLLFPVFFIFIFFPPGISAQVPDSLAGKDSISLLQDSLVAQSDSTMVSADSLQVMDSVSRHPLGNTDKSETPVLNELLLKNQFLNAGNSPVYFVQPVRPSAKPNFLFYYLFLMLLIFAILKSVYAKYFQTLWRVFFNTSMRQSQLSEQLKQAGQPSMFFNLLFILSGSWYVFLLMRFFNGPENSLYTLEFFGVICLGILGVYLGKFIILKFFGWVTGYSGETDNYIFIVFLINKIFAICLLPVLVVIAFASPALSRIAISVSFVLIGLMILMRFIRSYSTFQGKFKISSFHFMLYIAGMEIIPLLLLYKVAILYLNKKI